MCRSRPALHFPSRVPEAEMTSAAHTQPEIELAPSARTGSGDGSGTGDGESRGAGTSAMDFPLSTAKRGARGSKGGASPLGRPFEERRVAVFQLERNRDCSVKGDEW